MVRTSKESRTRPKYATSQRVFIFICKSKWKAKHYRTFKSAST